MSAFLAKLALHRISRHAEESQAWVHLYETKSGGQHLNLGHVHPDCHLGHQVAMRELRILNSKGCHADWFIYIFLFVSLNISILIHMIRIPSTT
jgi:hypothetical protein